MPKVLIADKMSPRAEEIFKERGLEVDVNVLRGHWTSFYCGLYYVDVISHFLYLLVTFLALPRLSLLGSFLRFLRTACAIAFLPPLARNLAAADFDKHLGLPSFSLASPHLPIRSPLVL